MNATQRTWLYGVATAIIPILVAYGLITTEHAPLWLALVAAVLAAVPSFTAIQHVTPDPGTPGVPPENFATPEDPMTPPPGA